MFKHTPKPIAPAEAARAAEVLGVQLEGLTEEGLQAAFRRAVRAAHPDTGAAPDRAAGVILGAKAARVTLHQWMQQQPADDCPTCRGSGYLRSSAFGTLKPCPRCQP